MSHKIESNQNNSTNEFWSPYNLLSYLEGKLSTFVKELFETISSLKEIEFYTSGKISFNATHLNIKESESFKKTDQDIGTANLPEIKEIPGSSDEEMKREIDPNEELIRLRNALIEKDEKLAPEYRIDDDQVKVTKHESIKLDNEEILEYKNSFATKKVTGCLLSSLGFISKEDQFESSANLHGPISEERQINSLDTIIRKHTIPKDRLHVAAILISKNNLKEETKSKLIHTLDTYKSADDTTDYKSLLDVKVSWEDAPEEVKKEAEAYLREAFSRGDAQNFNLANFGSKDATLLGGLTDAERDEIMRAEDGGTSYKEFLCTQILSNHLYNGTLTLQQLQNYLKAKRVSIADSSPLLLASKQLLQEIDDFSKKDL